MITQARLLPASYFAIKNVSELYMRRGERITADSSVADEKIMRAAALLRPCKGSPRT